MHAQGILPALQINLIFFLLVFSFSSSSFSSSLLIRVWQCLLLACPTSIHRRSVDDGMAAVCVCVYVRAREFSSLRAALVRSFARTWSCIQIGRHYYYHHHYIYILMEMQKDWRKKENEEDEGKVEKKESSS